MTFESWFWDNVQIGQENECWPWKLGCEGNGYGSIRRKPYRDEKAHRYAYKITYGEISDGMEICHSCHNPPCCNPLHLRADTHASNMMDKVEKGGYNHGEPCPQGHDVWTYNDVRRKDGSIRKQRICVICARERSLRHYHASKT